jgi:hypothetical protein
VPLLAGDDILSVKANAKVLLEQHEALGKVGEKLSHQDAMKTLNRPSTAQQGLNAITAPFGASAPPAGNVPLPAGGASEGVKGATKRQ